MLELDLEFKSDLNWDKSARKYVAAPQCVIRLLDIVRLFADSLIHPDSNKPPPPPLALILPAMEIYEQVSTSIWIQMNRKNIIPNRSNPNPTGIVIVHGC